MGEPPPALLPTALTSPTVLLPPAPLKFVLHNADGFWVRDRVRRARKTRYIVQQMRHADVGVILESHAEAADRAPLRALAAHYGWHLNFCLAPAGITSTPES